MRNLQFTERQLAEHEARMAKYRAEGRVRTVIDGRNNPPKECEPRRRGLAAPQRVKGSPLERAMLAQIVAAGIPQPEREYLPFEDRKFRIDFAWPGVKVALECDGHVHRIKARFHADIERHNLLLLAGWRVLRAGRIEIQDGRAMGWLKQALGIA